MGLFEGKKILFVDDEEFLRQVLAEVFADEGALVKEASNGIEGLSIAKLFLPDLVISDIRMPHGNGIDLLEQIRLQMSSKDAKSPRVILITGYADVKFEDVLAKGADAVFEKPFDVEKLKSKALLLLG